MSYATRLAALLVCILPLFMTAYGAEAEELKAGVFNPAREAPDFTVRGSDGAALTLSHYRGEVVMLSLGYTSCANVCAVTLAVLAQALRKLGSLGLQVQIIYLTVDPEHDDTERLKHYSAAFDPSFVRGTGTLAQMAAVHATYCVRAEKHGSGSDYALAHSSFVYFITRDGKLRALMPFGHKADEYVHDVSMLLN